MGRLPMTAMGCCHFPSPLCAQSAMCFFQIHFDMKFVEYVQVKECVEEKVHIFVGVPKTGAVF